MRHAVGSLAAAALAVGMLAIGILAWPVGSVYANGTAHSFAHDPNVRVFTPTPFLQDTAAPEPAEVQPVEVLVHVLLDALALERADRAALASALASEYREGRIHLTLAHRYTGFTRTYRGPRYPF